MRWMMKKLIVGLSLFAALVLHAGESPLGLRQVEIDIPPNSRHFQLIELCRQLGVPCIIDIGFDWKDAEERMEFDNLKPTFERFNVNVKTVKDALESFCKDRPFRWRLLDASSVIVLEPKKEEQRALNRVLAGDFALWPIDVKVTINTKAEYAIDFDKVLHSWTKVSNTGRHMLERYNYAMNSRHVPFSFFESEGKVTAPANMTEYLEKWLMHQDGLYVVLISGKNNDTVHGGLVLGSFPLKLGRLSAKSLVDRLWSSKNEEFVGHPIPMAYIEAELYRKRGNTDEICEALSVHEDLKGEGLFSQEWDVDTFIKIMLSFSERLSEEKRVKLILALPNPLDGYGEKLVPVWESLLKDKNPKINEFAKRVLTEWKEQRKAP
jgi:hypothetical protein